MVGGGKEEGREWKGGTYRVGIGYAGGFAVFDDARAVPEAEEEGGCGGEEHIASSRTSVEDIPTQKLGAMSSGPRVKEKAWQERTRTPERR